MKNIVFIMLLSLSMLASPLMAGDYLGEVCFRAESGDNTTRLMILGVSHMGGSHYQVAGTWNWEGTTMDDESAAINGNIEYMGDYLISTLTFSIFEDGFVRTRIANMGLNAESLSGTLTMIKHNKEMVPGTNIFHGVSYMPVSLVPCP